VRLKIEVFAAAQLIWSIPTVEGLPEGKEFMKLLNHWLESPTDESCPLGGKAGYSSALTVDKSSVPMSHFRTYHTPLKTQAEFIEAYAAAQRIAQDLSKRTGAEVFPYSLFYVFFASCELPRFVKLS
jgi:Niemann-Pick C1 protein